VAPRQEMAEDGTYIGFGQGAKFPSWLVDNLEDAIAEWNTDFTDIDWDIRMMSDGRIRIQMTLEFEEDDDGSL